MVSNLVQEGEPGGSILFPFLSLFLLVLLGLMVWGLVKFIRWIINSQW